MTQIVAALHPAFKAFGELYGLEIAHFVAEKNEYGSITASIVILSPKQCISLTVVIAPSTNPLVGAPLSVPVWHGRLSELTRTQAPTMLVRCIFDELCDRGFPVAVHSEDDWGVLLHFTAAGLETPFVISVASERNLQMESKMQQQQQELEKEEKKKQEQKLEQDEKKEKLRLEKQQKKQEEDKRKLEKEAAQQQKAERLKQERQLELARQKAWRLQQQQIAAETAAEDAVRQEAELVRKKAETELKLLKKREESEEAERQKVVAAQLKQAQNEAERQARHRLQFGHLAGSQSSGSSRSSSSSPPPPTASGGRAM
jgi:flagellar biosynthesis GTPase FlhF